MRSDFEIDFNLNRKMGIYLYYIASAHEVFHFFYFVKYIFGQQATPPPPCPPENNHPPTAAAAISSAAACGSSSARSTPLKSLLKKASVDLEDANQSGKCHNNYLCVLHF